MYKSTRISQVDRQSARRHSSVSCVKMTVWVVDSDGPRESCVTWGSRSHPQEAAIFVDIGAPVVNYRDFLPWPMQKRPNRLMCRSGYGLGWWAEGSTRSIVFAKWRQCAIMGGHISTTYRIRLNHLSAAAMCLMSNDWALVIFGHAHLNSCTDSRALRAVYCIAGIPHSTAILSKIQSHLKRVAIL